MNYLESLLGKVAPFVVIKAPNGKSLFLPVTLQDASNLSSLSDAIPGGFKLALSMGEPKKDDANATLSKEKFWSENGNLLLKGWIEAPPKR